MNESRICIALDFKTKSDVENFLKSPEGQAAVGSQVHVLHMRISGEAPATSTSVPEK